MRREGDDENRLQVWLMVVVVKEPWVRVDGTSSSFAHGAIAVVQWCMGGEMRDQPLGRL